MATSELDADLNTMFCCPAMDTWSKPDRRVFYRTHLGSLTGIIQPWARSDDGTFVSIKFCPFCGTLVTYVEDTLIGKQMRELSHET